MNFCYRIQPLLCAGISLVLLGCAATESSEEISRPPLVSSLPANSDTNSSQNTQPSSAIEIPESVQAYIDEEARDDSVLSLQPSTYDVQADALDARLFFASLVADTPFSVAIHPEVTGKVTLDLKQVTLEQVFDVVSRLYGYQIERQGSIYNILPFGLQTRTYTVNYLMMSRNGLSQVSVSTGGVSQAANQQGLGGNQQSLQNSTASAFGGSSSNNNARTGNQNNGTNINSSTETAFWQNLEETLTSFFEEKSERSVLIAPQAGLVTVTAMPDELALIEDFLMQSQNNLQRQVILEARILEVTLEDEFQQGINWGELSDRIGGTDISLTTATASSNFGNDLSGNLGGLSTIRFDNTSFDGVISLLDTQGDVRVLSSPRVTAMNNQKALIKVGNDEYFVTDISSQTTSAGDSIVTQPDIELTPFFSGIALDVTPQIDADDGVLLHVHPSVITTAEQVKEVFFDGQTVQLPLAQSAIRETDTLIRALSGEIVVLGGLMQTRTTDQQSKTPILGDLPGLGRLFKSTRQREQKTELIILIKPTVVKRPTQTTLPSWSSLEQR